MNKAQKKFIAKFCFILASFLLVSLILGYDWCYFNVSDFFEEIFDCFFMNIKSYLIIILIGLGIFLSKY